MTTSLLERCVTRVVIGDGAMGTELQRAGLPVGDCGERWVLDHPDRLEAIHRAYIAAGSEAVITCSFGANRWVLGRYGLGDQVDEVNRAAARIAREAAGDDAVVLGDIGPCGGFLRPVGEIDAAELAAEFERQARALLDGGVQGIIIETMTAVEELKLAIEASLSAGAPYVIASLAFDKMPTGAIRTMMGVAPEQAARAAVAAGAAVVGANCGTRMSPIDFAVLVRAFRSVTDKPIMIQANAGSPELVDGAVVYRLGPDDFAAGMKEVVAAGAQIAGGCCGTTPAHIRALATQLAARGV